MLAHPGQPFDVAPFVDSRCKTPIEEIQAAIDGAISPKQAVKLRQCLSHINELQDHLQEIEREILRLSDKYQAALDLIRTAPGFHKNPMTAIQVLSEIGGDMSVFPPPNTSFPGLDVVLATTKATKKSNPLEFPVLVLILNLFWYKLQMVYCVRINILK